MGSSAVPALVSARDCGRRSNSGRPRRASRPITWRLTALCDTPRVLAAAVKLSWRPTASKARRALSGSQRLSKVTMGGEHTGREGRKKAVLF